MAGLDKSQKTVVQIAVKNKVKKKVKKMLRM
jgi:hypothetical protein